jgi:predicted secreted protein
MDYCLKAVRDAAGLQGRDMVTAAEVLYSAALLCWARNEPVRALPLARQAARIVREWKLPKMPDQDKVLADLEKAAPAQRDPAAAKRGFRVIHIPKRDKGYGSFLFLPTVVRTNECFYEFLYVVVRGGAYRWNDRPRLLKALQDAGLDFDKETLVVFYHSETSGATQVTFEAPVRQGNKVLCKVRRKESAGGAADMAFYAFALAVDKAVTGVEFQIEGKQAQVVSTEREVIATSGLPNAKWLHLGLRDPNNSKELNGKNLPMQVGQMVSLVLLGDPATDYQWFVAKIEGKAVQLCSASVTWRYTRRKAVQPPAGVATGKAATTPDQGERKSDAVFGFVFRAEKAGSATVLLEYRLPWEKDKPPAQTMTITFDVTAAGK